MPPKFYFTTKSELAEEERKRFLKEVETLPPNAPLRQDLSAFLPATLPKDMPFATAKPDNTGAIGVSERGQQDIERANYQAQRDKKGAEFFGRSYGEQKDLRQGGDAIGNLITEMSPVGTAQDIERAVTDPSLMNVGVAAATMVPGVGKGLKKVAKRVGALDSAKDVQKLDNAIIKNNPEMEKVFMPPPKNAAKTQRAGTFPTYVKAVKILDEISGGGKMIDFSSRNWG